MLTANNSNFMTAHLLIPKQWGIGALLLLSLAAGPAMGAPATALPGVVASETIVKNPCTPLEKWELGPLLQIIPVDVQREFHLFLAGERTAYATFAEITGLRSTFQGGVGLAFADYWLGRSLYAAKLYPEAAIYFDHLVSITPNRDRVMLQLAAMACLQRIHDESPQIEYSKEALANLPAFFEPWLVPKQELPILWEATVHYALNNIVKGETAAAEQSLVLLEGTGPWEHFIQGLWSIRQEEMEVAISSLTQLLKTSNLPPSIEARRNQLRLLLATALYEKKDYKGATVQLELVDKKSNELVEALSLLSSAQLLAGEVSKSLGTAAGLKSGGFRTTFAPEAYLTVSMALNELCRHPEALSSLSDFRREFDSSYRWLRRWTKGAGAEKPLYPLAVAFVNGSDTSVPARVASEWVRSPIFITHQRAINSILRTVKSMPTLANEILLARKAYGKELSDLQEMLGAVGTPTKAEKSSTPRLTELMTKQAIVQVQARMNRLELATQAWLQVLRHNEENAGIESAKLVVTIEAHLKRITERMLRQLNRASDDNELVRAELLSVASSDMVFQGANPEFQKMAEGQDPGSDRRPASSVWRVSDGPGDLEIWADELGVIEANLEDTCAAKERYLELRKHN